MGADSVISFVIDDTSKTRSTKKPGKGFTVYVRDYSKESTDLVSAIEFIRETFDVEVSKTKRARSAGLIRRNQGRQILELIMDYMPPSRQPDARDPYAKIEPEDILRSDSIIPIFDVDMLFSQKMTVAKKTATYAGILRNVRDAYVFRKTVSTFGDFLTTEDMYANAMRTFLPTSSKVIPMALERHVADLGHVAFRIESGLTVRKKQLRDSAMISPDESTDSNVIGSSSLINTRSAGPQFMVSQGIKYGLSGLIVRDAKTEKTETFVLPDDVLGVVRAIATRSVKTIMFSFSRTIGPGSGSAAIRSILAAGIDDFESVIAAKSAASWRDVMFAGLDRKVTGSMTPREMRDIVDRVTKATYAKMKFPEGLVSGIVTDVETDTIKAPIDDLILEAYYSIDAKRRRFGDVAEAEMLELISISANLIDGVYYSKFTGDELEFFKPIEDTIEGLTFDEELALLSGNFRESDFLGMYDQDSAAEEQIRRIIAISGSAKALSDASNIKRGTKVPLDKTARRADFPDFLALRETNATVDVYPGRTSTEIRGSESASETFSDAGTSHILDLVHKETLAELAVSMPGLIDEHAIKTGIVSIFERFAKITGTDYTRELVERSNVSGTEITGAIFKIGTFDNIYDDRGKTYEIARMMQESWRFTTALRQELAVISNFSYVDPTDEDASRALSQMHLRSLVARSRLRTILPGDIFRKLEMPPFPSPAAMSPAYPTNVSVSDRAFKNSVLVSRGLSFIYVAEMLGRTFAYVTGEQVVLPVIGAVEKRPESVRGLSAQGQVAVLKVIEDAFLNVLAEELALREYTDVDGYSAPWVFQELWTETAIRIKSAPLKDDDDDLDDIPVPVDDDETVEEAEESWALQDSIAEELSTFFSEYDD